jgi:hypothetical protein
MGEDVVGTRSRAEAVASALAHAAIAAIATWPMLETPLTRLVGHPNVDVWNHAWGAWWFLEEISAGRAPLWASQLGAPAGGYLWYIDPIGAFVSAPVAWAFGVVPAWNALVFGYVALASVAGRALARALGASATASWVGAVATAISPYLLSEVHNGISEAVGVGWSVLALAAVVRAERGNAPRDWALAGLFGGMTAVGTVYYALGLAFAALPFVVVALVRGARGGAAGAVVRGVLLGAALAACIAVPAYLAVRQTLAGPALIGRPDTPLGDPRTLMILAHNAVDPRSFVMPGAFQSVDVRARGEFFLHTSYVGAGVMLLALLARRRTAWVAAIVTLAFSLGPFLYWDGGFVALAGGRWVALPYRWLFEVLPTSALGHPQRTGFPGLALLGALAAVGVGRLGAVAWARTAIVAVACVVIAAEFVVLSPAQWPIARTEAVDLRHAEVIRAEAAADAARAGIVFDLPADTPGQGMSPSRYLLYQTHHGQPLPYTPDVRGAECRLGVPSAGALLQQDLREPARPFVPSDLSKLGVRWVVLHEDLGDTRRPAELLERALGPPQRVGAKAIWRIVP